MKEIRDAVGWAKAEVELLYGYDDVLNKNTKEMLNIFIDLAEKVLAVEGKMPEISNEPAFYCPMEILSHAEYKGRKEAIEQCTLAITGALLSITEIEEIINSRQDCPNCDNSGRIMPDGEQCEFCYSQENSKFNLATSIHSAQMEKIGGVR